MCIILNVFSEALSIELSMILFQYDLVANA